MLIVEVERQIVSLSVELLPSNVFQIDIESKESVHTGLETLTHLIRNRKLLLSAHESH